MEPTSTAQWIRAQRDARGLTATALADAVRVSHVSVLNWESGRNSPNKDSMRRLVDFFKTAAPPPAGGIPERVVMAAMELAEWAIAPVSLPSEPLATEDDLQAMQQLLRELPPDVTKALRKLGGFTPKRRGGGGRRRPKDQHFGLDLFRAHKAAGDVQRVYDAIEEMGASDATEALSWPLYPDRDKGGPNLRDLAVRLGVPLPRLLNDGWWYSLVGEDRSERDPVRSIISHYHLFYWMRDLNFTAETLAEDMGVALEEVTAVLEYRAETTTLWFERWERATGTNAGVVGWVFTPPEPAPHMELRISTFREHVMRSELNGENARLSEFRRVTPEHFAEILCITTEELRCILEGETMATTAFCERVLRGLSISSENGMMVAEVPADRRIPIRA